MVRFMFRLKLVIEGPILVYFPVCSTVFFFFQSVDDSWGEITFIKSSYLSSLPCSFVIPFFIPLMPPTSYPCTQELPIHPYPSFPSRFLTSQTPSHAFFTPVNSLVLLHRPHLHLQLRHRLHRPRLPSKRLQPSLQIQRLRASLQRHHLRLVLSNPHQNQCHRHLLRPRGNLHRPPWRQHLLDAAGPLLQLLSSSCCRWWKLPVRLIRRGRGKWWRRWSLGFGLELGH